MPRPALSASRSVKILNLLASFPGRAFTLSEIARAADINVASCHAVLNALEADGYLQRCPRQKTYFPGPSLVAVGESALKSHPLLAKVKLAGRQLAHELELPVLVMTRVNDELLVVDSIADAAGRPARLQTGQRVAHVPPVGALFAAWSADAPRDAWLNRMASSDARYIEEWRQGIAQIRRQGYQLLMRSTEHSSYSQLMAEMAAYLKLMAGTAARRDTADHQNEVSDLQHFVDGRLYHAGPLEPAGVYQAVQISVPIFAENGEVAYSMSLVEFSGETSGKDLMVYADRLMKTSLDVMGVRTRVAEK